MPDAKISQLPSVATPVSTDEFPVNQSNVTKKMTRVQVHTLESGEHLVLPQDNDAVTPTIGFGVGANTGFYESSANTLNVSIDGTSRFFWTGNDLRGQAANAVLVRNTVCSATAPTLCPNKGDANTGIGATVSTLDELSLIAGGVQVANLTEAAGVVQLIVPLQNAVATPSIAIGDGDSGWFEAADDAVVTAIGGVEAHRFTGDGTDIIIAHEANVGLTAEATTPAQGDAPITSSKNVYSTVANAGDAVTLPATFIVGTEIYVQNDGANSMDVFPASGDTITPNAINVAEAVAAGVGALFIATAADATWSRMRLN